MSSNAATAHSIQAVNTAAFLEGMRNVAYRDGGGIWTIGYGHTAGVKPGDYITVQQARTLLDQDLCIADADIRHLVKVPLNQNQWDGLCVFVLNIGFGHFRDSTLLHKLNAGDYAGAAAQFSAWTMIDGKTSKGLQNRRAAEHNLFTRPVQPQPQTPPTQSGHLVNA